MNDTSAAHLEKISYMLRSPERVEHRLSEDDFEIQAGSDLDGDDAQVVNYYKPSNQAERSIGIAVSHWKALTQCLLTEGHGWTNSYYPLIRAAIENAASAYWMLASDDRKIRVHRQLLIGWADLDEDSKAFRAGSDPNSKLLRDAIKERDDKKANIVKLAELNGKPLPEKPKYNYIDLIQAVPIHPQISPPEVIWRACSGMAHGKWWAFYLLSGRSNERTVDNSTQRAEFELDLQSLMVCIGVGVYVLEQAVEMFDKRRRAPQSSPAE